MPHDPAQPNPPRRRLRLVTVIMAGGAALIVFTGVTSRREAYTRLSHWTEEQAVPVVAVALPNTRPARTGMDFPGRLEAYSQAQIFARVSGYIREWKADIGAPVKSGQPLAEIDAPDLDQQIMQAKADLASAQANVTLSKATMDRGNSLIGSGAVSKADLDQRVADYENKQGLMGSAQANLDRLRVLEKYKSILAPFDGLVTARATDVGALINAGSGGARPCSWSPMWAGCAPISACRRTSCPVSGSAAAPRSPFPNTREEAFPPPSRPRRRLSMSHPAPRGCNSSSTTRNAS
jgi:multidrug efflux pump subunit AcrA (membrane-fusion protein)